MSKQKVTLRIEEGEVELLKRKFRTDNQSEAIRLAIIQSLVTEDLKKVKTLFPYIGKKPPRIGRAVAYYYVSFGAYRGRMDNPLFMISTSADTNRADTYKKMCSGFCNYLSGYRMWRF